MDAAPRVREAREPGVDATARLDPLDPACTTSLDLERALTDARCAISGAKSQTLRAALEARGPATLAQEATIEDGRVLLKLGNKGEQPLVLPLSWHPDVPSFSMLVEDASHALYEMDAPKLAPPDSGTSARFARVQLSPGAVATVRVALPSRVLRRIAPACEAGTCAPPKLPPGKYRLHIGQLITDVESGLPADVAWTIP